MRNEASEKKNIHKTITNNSTEQKNTLKPLLLNI
jgi:hypothetical protein